MTTVLLTGATGFIGGATAAELLAPPRGPVICLVRAPSADAARERLRRSLQRFLAAPLAEEALGKCEVIAGDLGDDRALQSPCLDQVTHVLHLAANTSFVSVRGVRRSNIEGTLALARRMSRAPRLVRFLYVSTAFLCGAAPPSVVHETDFPRQGAPHLVEYTRSKAETELLLHASAPRLPLLIARPSIVVGHTRLGCLPSASIFWYYRAMDLLRRTCVPLATRKDIVPVDWAAQALLALLFKPTLRHPCYHVSCGEAACVTWQEMGAAFNQVHGERPDEPCEVVDHPTLVRERHRMRALLGPGDEEHLLGALAPYLRFSSCGVEVFDNRRLLEEGVPPPPRFTSYLPLCAMLPSGRSVYEQMRDDE